MFFLAFGLPCSAFCPYPPSFLSRPVCGLVPLTSSGVEETCTDKVGKHTGGDVFKPAPIEKYLQMVMPALARFNTRACPISSLS